MNISDIKEHIVMFFMISFVTIFLPLSCVHRNDIEITEDTKIPVEGFYSLKEGDCSKPHNALSFEGLSLTETLSNNSTLNYELVNMSKRSRGRFLLEYFDIDKNKLYFSMMLSMSDNEALYIYHSRRYLVNEGDASALDSFPAFQETTFYRCPQKV